MLPAGESRMEWTLCLVGMGIDGKSTPACTVAAAPHRPGPYLVAIMSIPGPVIEWAGIRSTQCSRALSNSKSQ
jgi:hypothetical protein